MASETLEQLDHAYRHLGKALELHDAQSMLTWARQIEDILTENEAE